MPRTEVIQARIDPDTKHQAQNILSALNINMSEAIAMFLRQVVIKRGIPFDLKVPNELTARTLEETEKGSDIHRASDVNELFGELDI